MKNELIVVGTIKKQTIPTDWNYTDSVGKVRGFIYKVKNLTEDVLRELSIAREILSKSGGYEFHKEVRGTKVPSTPTWSEYCEDIGSSRQVVDRWLKPHLLPEPVQEPTNNTEYVPDGEYTPDTKTETETNTEDPEEPVTAQKNSTFNHTNDNIEWAHWTWNPVTGCKHGCKYCYARDIAVRFGSDENSPFYPHKFAPHFYPERLDAPFNTKVPNTDDVGDKNVFCVSMGDLFGKWVPQEWIDGVVGVVRKAPQWNFIFLTKNPVRLIDVDWPDNAWVGTTVDEQARIETAEEAFAQVEAKVKFVSVEPFRERLTFNNLELFNWAIIGGQSKSTGEPGQQPEWEWVNHIYTQARDAGCMIYFKPNLKVVQPKEYPCLTK